MQPLPYSVEGVNYLKKFHKLYNTTSRPNEIIKETYEQIEKYYTDSFSGIFFSSNNYAGWKNCGKTKAEICLEIGASLMIEDSLEYALECAEREVKVFLLDAPWNQNGEHKNIRRIYGYPNYWREIFEILK